MTSKPLHLNILSSYFRSELVARTVNPDKVFAPIVSIPVGKKIDLDKEREKNERKTQDFF